MTNRTTWRGFTQTEKNVVIKLASFPKFVIGNLSRLPFTNSGFTFIELLVVVLIIGVLAAIALPQYQKAVLKSRFAALMPIAKNMANSNEAYYLEHGNYADNTEELPVQGQMDYPDSTELEFGTTSEYAYVLASRGENFPNHYIVYQKHSEKFPDNIHCEADENNTQAQEVCLSLGGQKIEGSLKDGFLTYVLSGMRGINDKFPSSLTKLAKKLCGTNENCDYDIDPQAQTVTLKECTDYSNNTNPEYLYCTLRTYNDAEQLVEQFYTSHRCKTQNVNNSYYYECTDETIKNSHSVFTTTQCLSGVAEMRDGECVLTATTSSIVSQKDYLIQEHTEQGLSLQNSKACAVYQNGACTVEKVRKDDVLSSGNRLIMTAYCDGAAASDFTCSTYNSKTGSNTVTFALYNPSNQNIANIHCNSANIINSSSVPCSRPESSSSLWNRYDGNTYLGYNRVSYTDDKVVFSIKDTQGNEIDTVSCTADKANWETGTCNS